MELVRRTIRMTRQKGKAISQMTLDDDYNIPETMPDVSMIMSGERQAGDRGNPGGKRPCADTRRICDFRCSILTIWRRAAYIASRVQIPFEESMNVERAERRRQSEAERHPGGSLSQFSSIPGKWESRLWEPWS